MSQFDPPSIFSISCTRALSVSKGRFEEVLGIAAFFGPHGSVISKDSASSPFRLNEDGSSLDQSERMDRE